MTLLLYDLCGRDRSLRFSPYCWRVRMAIAHKALSAETVATSFTEIAGVENGISPTVPVINDDGTIVRESFDIALYLDRAHPDRPSLFGDEATVAACRVIEGWANAIVQPVLMRMMAKDIHDVLDGADRRYFRSTREKRFGRSLEEHQTGLAANAEALAAALQPARHALGHFDWLGGSSPRFADYIVFGSLMWLRTIAGRVPLAAEDSVAAWFDRCLDLYGGIARSAPAARAA